MFTLELDIFYIIYGYGYKYSINIKHILHEKSRSKVEGFQMNLLKMKESQ